MTYYHLCTICSRFYFLQHTHSEHTNHYIWSSS